MNAYLFFFVVASVAAVSSTTKVIGGGNANIANYPYQVSLRNGQGTAASHSCGATLISNTQALTAAHCGGGPIASYSILAGTTDRTTLTCATCALRPLREFNRHEDFSNSPAQGYPNDVAIAVFYSIATNTNIKFATLATEEDGDFHGAQCVITGWGRQSPGGPMATSLQEGSLAVLSNEECASQWGVDRIKEYSLCARDAVRAPCGGDNGGPLECNGVVAGIFSWSEANCSPAFASVFIRVSAYRDWIETQLLKVDDAEPVPVDESIEQGWGWR